MRVGLMEVGVVSGPWVGLADAVAGLRAELTEAIDRRAAQGDRGVQFGLGPIELTVQAALTRQGEVGVKWQVLTATGSAGSQSTQTLKLVLTPVWRMADGTVVEGVRIGDLEPETAPGHGPEAGRAAGQDLE